jgi:sec-independent protein translocase protein TatB
MFDFDVGKLLLFGIVALAVIPPKDLPRVMRTVGQTVGKMRRMAAEFQNQFMDAMREADVESLKKEIEALNDAAKVDVSFDPATAMRDELTTAVHGKAEIGSSTVELASPKPEESAPAIVAETAESNPVATPEPESRIAVESVAGIAEPHPVAAPETEPKLRVASQSAAE